MNLDKVFVRKMLEGGSKAYAHVVKVGINEDHLFGEGKAAFAWATKYLGEHGSLPSPELTEVNLGIVLDESDAVLPFLEQEVMNRALFNVLQDGMEKITVGLEQRKPQEAFTEMLAVVDAARKVGLTASKIESLLALGEKVLEHYEKMKAGAHGILTPWPSINEMTMGFWPEDLVGVIARPGIGKTWLLTLMMRQAWLQGERPLVVSTEMSQMKMAMRFYSAHLKLPFKQFRKGKLGEFVENSMREKVKLLIKEANLNIVGGDFDMTMEAVDEAVREVKPTIVFIDGIYLMKQRARGGKKDDRYTRVAEVLDEAKRQPKRFGIPYVFTSQFKKGSKNDKEGAEQDNVGFTDAINQNSDNLYGMVQTDDMAAEKKMMVKPMKLREGEGFDVHLRWDFDMMDFTEEGRSAEYQDSDFSDGFRPASQVLTAPTHTQEGAPDDDEVTF